LWVSHFVLEDVKNCFDGRKKYRNEAWVSFRKVESPDICQFLHVFLTGSHQKINCNISVHLNLSLCLAAKTLYPDNEVGYYYFLVEGKVG
jgi:hypothetical protein